MLLRQGHGRFLFACGWRCGGERGEMVRIMWGCGGLGEGIFCANFLWADGDWRERGGYGRRGRDRGEHPLFWCRDREWEERHPQNWCRERSRRRFGLCCGAAQELCDVDVGVGYGRAVCEGRHCSGGRIGGEECEHVVCGLAEIVVGGGFGKRGLVGKPINS